MNTARGKAASRSPWQVALVLTGLLSPGCGAPRSLWRDPSAPVHHAPLEADIRGLDPAHADDVPTSRVLGAMHRPLLQYAYLERPFRVEPDLASAMPTVSPDGLVWSFPLRRDVRFHPDDCFPGPERTRTVVAGDLVFAWKRLADPRTKSGAWWMLAERIVGLDAWRAEGADYARPVPGLVARDDHTFELRLTRPYPQLPWILTMVATAPVAPEAVRKYGEGLLEHSVGTGPFQLHSRVPGSRIELVRSPVAAPEKYPSAGSTWARDHGLLAAAGSPLPRLEGIVFEVIREPQTAWLRFLKGELDRAEIPKDEMRVSLKAPGVPTEELARRRIVIQSFPSQTLWWIEMNLRDPVFAGVRGRHLRRAIAHAHDSRRFLELMAGGLGTPAVTLIPPGLSGSEAAADPSVGFPGYDPEAAKAALAAAGWPGGSGAPELRIDLRGDDPSSRQAAEFLAAELTAIGLRTRLDAQTWSAFQTKAHQGGLMLYLRRWVGDYPDEENWTQLFFGPNADQGTNWSGFADPEYDALHQEVRDSTDSPVRRQKLTRMMAILARELPLRPSYVALDQVPYHPWLGGFMHGEPIYNGVKYLAVDGARRAAGPGR